MEAENGGLPLVIDKTKEIQVSVYPVYITTKVWQSHARTSAQTSLTNTVAKYRLPALP